ncbi:RNA polymerase sigma factor [Streptomyces niveiscabiei]|uniref:RNA polymerase sigma factor n=1 Tax=Streptomyces niveiscabiei TaxID=164115 RepID=UPI0029A87CC3|nr:RNA polymerase sigma factor [Streptomyces niveiscabiei]MDX3385349.1 RNA polymerase sigma factor [Streptomyces niveiscabiei]
METGEQDGDDELLAALGEGDRAAFETLYRCYAPWLATRLRYRCADPGQLDDIVQETFLAVWRRCTEGRQPVVRDFGGWLWRIAARRLTDEARTHGVHSRLQRALYGLRAPVNPSAEDLVLATGRFGPLEAALGKLSPDLREVVQATVVDGLTTRQAARRLRVPPGTVKTRTMRARRLLREELDRSGEADDPTRGHTGREGRQDP